MMRGVEGWQRGCWGGPQKEEMLGGRLVELGMREVELMDGRAGGGMQMALLRAAPPVLQVWHPWITRQQGGWGCGQLCTTW